MNPYVRSIRCLWSRNSAGNLCYIEIVESVNRHAIFPMTSMCCTHLMNAYTGHALHVFYPAWTIEATTAQQHHVQKIFKGKLRCGRLPEYLTDATLQLSRVCCALSCPNSWRSPMDRNSLHVHFQDDDSPVDPSFRWRLKMQGACCDPMCKPIVARH